MTKYIVYMTTQTKCNLGGGESLEQNFNEGIYAKIDKQFLMMGNEWFLEPEELYIFTVLALCERKDGVIRTSFHMIDSILTEKFDRARKDNNKQIAEVIHKLVRKKIVKISGIPDEKQYYEFFYVEIQYDSYQKSREEGWIGYESLYWREFERLEKINYLYIYCIVKTNQGTGRGFKCSYDIWTEKTNFSLSSVKRYISDMSKKELIFNNRGDYLDGSRNKQDINIYRTYEFTKEELTNRSKNYELENKKKEVRKRKNAFGEPRENKENNTKVKKYKNGKLPF